MGHGNRHLAFTDQVNGLIAVLSAHSLCLRMDSSLRRYLKEVLALIEGV
jgi:hypothetical protein